jgi:hypothetical protein
MLLRSMISLICLLLFRGRVFQNEYFTLLTPHANTIGVLKNDILLPRQVFSGKIHQI